MEKHSTMKTVMLVVAGFGLLAGLVTAIRRFALADK